MNDTQSKVSLKRKKQSKRYCINLFKKRYFKKSPDKFRNIGNLDDFNGGERRLTRGMLRELDKQNALFSLSKEHPSRSSEILINDSDNETSEEDEKDASLSIIECSPPTLPSSTQQESEKKESRKSLRQNKNRSSITLSNLSMKQSSSTQSPCNGENIAPSETEDDVIELWSSLKKSPNKKIYYHNEIKTLNFVIDTKPDLKNLEYLKSDTKSVQKRRKLCRKHCDKHRLTSSLNKKIKKANNNSNLSNSNPQSCEEKTKTIVSSKQNSPDSNHKLREIVVDGSNVAMAHANHQMFSVKGIQLVIDYFTIRGHDVKVFLPNYFRKYALLEELYKKGIVVFTPSRNIKGKQITPYEDRFILEYATACEGIVISSDQYRDLYEEKPEWRDTILNRLLTPTFVGDYIMFPEDPLGKSGPNLETFLRH